MSEKAKFVQLCCDFYNEHSESDKQWFARNYDQCDEPHQKDNICMYQWQFPLFVLRAQQAEIDQLKEKVSTVLSKWKKESEHADHVASEDFVQNVLDACIEDLEKALNMGDTPCAQTNSSNFLQESFFPQTILDAERKCGANHNE